MVDLERDDGVAVALEAVVPSQYHRRDGVRQAPEDARERAKQLVEPFGPVDGEWDLTAAEGERLEHPGKAQVVIRVVVREEDVLELDEPDVAAQQLPLRALRAVEEQPIAPTPDECRAECALRRRHGT